ncbi:unnamed protein product [Paramecium pentaurelia]|uniref:Uncharacterized protein n=1 Tax=Paramecium pentaurelia TaxID=43138 RepID=A0A8S1WKX7_9CILI|nr:unnamed protein product [Paramecium pentaurelia]
MIYFSQKPNFRRFERSTKRPPLQKDSSDPTIIAFHQQKSSLLKRLTEQFGGQFFSISSNSLFILLRAIDFKFYMMLIN